MFKGYRDVYFAPPKPEMTGTSEEQDVKPARPGRQAGQEQNTTAGAPDGDKPAEGEVNEDNKGPDISANNLYRLVLNHLMKGDMSLVNSEYVFDTKPLTNDRPYFAGYIKVLDIPSFLDKFESISDDWGYLLLWATLLQSLIFGLVLI